MPNILTTSLTGLRAFQNALDVSGHNIANANTPGYSRQVAEFSSRVGSGTGVGHIGAGTQITTIKRIYDDLLGEQLQTSTTTHARFATLNSLATQIDTLLADPQTGLGSSLQSFFNSVQDLANDPSSVPIRQAVLGETDSVIQRFAALDNRLQDIDSGINESIQESVHSINNLANEIAKINEEIVVARGRTGQPPNDLLDNRDRLITQLSEQIAVRTIQQDDGSTNVFIGSGQALVTGVAVNQLAVRGDEFNSSRLQIVYLGNNGSTALDDSLSGGIVGGLLDFRGQLLDPTRTALGETALALTTQFNEQHRSGIDLRGALGGDFFGVDPPQVLISANNAGSGLANATITDLSANSGGDYLLQFDGANYSLRDAASGQAIALSGSGTAVDPFVADGLSIEVSGVPASGDQILIRPSIAVAGSIRRTIADPQEIAMASPVRVSSANTNIGDAAISGVAVLDRDDPNLLTPALIEFTSPTTYSINGAGAFAYTSGTPISLNGSSFSINGAPAGGDTFTLEANFGAVGDNTNGLRLAGVQAERVLAGGTVSINESYSQLIASVGGTTRQVQSGLDAQAVLLANAEESIASNSGVNLDEEAANLIRFQQAYQAVAQVIAVANTLFDSLLAATRR